MANAPSIAEFLAAFCCSLFTGAAVYITLVEHPARMACSTELAAAQFPQSYRRAAPMQGALAILGFLSALWAWLEAGNIGWLVGGVLLGSVVPFTLVAIMPTNKQLLDPERDRRSEQTRLLLSRWARLHAVRSVLSLLALIIFLYMLADA